jgi:pyridoxal phosphate enzyme (YggS family)
MNGPDPQARARECCRDNLARVRQRIAAACDRAGRDPAGVTLVVATKSVGPTAVALLHEAGCHDLAESRPQALWAKAAASAELRPSVRWHLIGHLQRNKVQRTLPHAALIHSLDSLRLLAAIDAEAEAAGKVQEALVEVNLSSDPNRTGADEAEAERIVAAAAGLRHVLVRGLMGMASVPDGDPHAARREFARLREFRDRLAGSVAGGDRLRDLSMGMSGDFEEAILEGATLVRLGSVVVAGLSGVDV